MTPEDEYVDVQSELITKMAGAAVRHDIIGLVVVATVWEIIVFYSDTTWIITATNIIFLLASLIIGAALKYSLAIRMPGSIAWIIALVIVGLAVMVLRPLEDVALTAISGVGSGDEIQEYYDGIGPGLIPATDATEGWSSLVEKHALIDASTLTKEELRVVIEEELESATNAYLSANAAIHIMMAITPPERCVASHVATIGSLQLMERGFLELKGYMELVTGSGRVDNEKRELGNRLLAEADQVKQTGIPSALECSP